MVYWLLQTRTHIKCIIKNQSELDDDALLISLFMIGNANEAYLVIGDGKAWPKRLRLWRTYSSKLSPESFRDAFAEALGTWLRQWTSKRDWILNDIVTQGVANPRQEVFSRYINCKKDRGIALNLLLKSSADLLDRDPSFISSIFNETIRHERWIDVYYHAMNELVSRFCKLVLI